MLTRLAVGWASTLVGTRLEALRQENADRFRLSFASDGLERTLIASIDPRHPWLAESTRRWEGPLWSPDRALAAAVHALVGRRVARIDKHPPDRTIRFDLGDGRGIVFELTPRMPTLVLLGEGGVVAWTSRRANGADTRLTLGHPWSARAVPHGRLDPFSMTSQEIDAARGTEEPVDVPDEEWLAKRFLGIGSGAAELVAVASRRTGASIGTVLRERLDSILSGSSEVVIEGPRLLPWRPDSEAPGLRWEMHGDVGATAGFYFEARDASERVTNRISALLGILRRELGRARKAEQRVRGELAAFEDPEKFTRMGEALLAGLHSARREGDTVLVADPYDPAGREIVIPAPAGRALTTVADDLFKRQRRARRGLAAAGSRADTLKRRMSGFEALLAGYAAAADGATAEKLEASMRELGLPVGLTAPTRASRAAARVSPPQLEGVRMITSTDGWTILVGRTGPANDRLTFKIAAPDDLWLHASGVPGAHVVIRNPERKPRVPSTTLAEAAGLALWFSDARTEQGADVQWTKRKNVRRAKGGSSGRVVIKRFETIRTSPRPPAEEN